jgi:large subunit ribosomal protein L19
MRNKLLEAAEKSSLREQPLQFAIGDTVDVHTRILEGSKERIQKFSGVVIARRGSGTREMFTVRRIVQGEGVERTFPTNSPKVASHRSQASRPRSPRKLFYLRDRAGKATRLRERNALAPGKLRSATLATKPAATHNTQNSMLNRRSKSRAAVSF